MVPNQDRALGQETVGPGDVEQKWEDVGIMVPNQGEDLGQATAHPGERKQLGRDPESRPQGLAVITGSPW